MRSYPAKLLLFGEHTVLVGSSALAIPLPMYSMSWAEKRGEHPDWLSDYASYLIRECDDIIDGVKLKSHLENFSIVGNIPIGYGLGSSGALTAAIYDICGSDTDHLDYVLHQESMGRMESFFHGQSSGFDPLISYVGRPIYRTSDRYEVGERSIHLNIAVGLLDSGVRRSGREKIQLFLDAYEANNEQFFPLIEHNSQASLQLYDPHTSLSLGDVKKISELQLELMDFLITPEVRELWKMGLETDDYYIKICGAGGGGYYLVFADRKIRSLDKALPISWID